MALLVCTTDLTTDLSTHNRYSCLHTDLSTDNRPSDLTADLPADLLTYTRYSCLNNRSIHASSLFRSTRRSTHVQSSFLFARSIYPPICPYIIVLPGCTTIPSTHNQQSWVHTWSTHRPISPILSHKYLFILHHHDLSSACTTSFVYDHHFRSLKALTWHCLTPSHLVALHTFATWCHPIQRYRTMHVIIHRRCNTITPAQNITIDFTKERQNYTSVHLLRYTLLSSQSSPPFQPTPLSTISHLSPSHSSHSFLIFPLQPSFSSTLICVYLISLTSSARL